MRVQLTVCAVAALARVALAQSSCSASVSASVPAPSVAPGFDARLIATGLYKPRGITFDQQGNLLVVEQQSGVVALKLNDAGGSCLSEQSRHTVVNDTTVSSCLMSFGLGR